MTTDRLLFAAALMSWAGVTCANGQALVQLSPLDMPTDPRGVGMGESLVALRANAAALSYNPAGLAGLTGAGISYGERSMAWAPFVEGYRFYGASAFAETPVGVFSARYDRFTQQNVPLTSPGTFATIVNLSNYSHDVVLGYGVQLTNRVEAGVAAKYYDEVFHEDTGGDPTISIPLPSTTPAWLFDAGVLYTFPGVLPEGKIGGELTVGFALQNVGTKVKYHAQVESGPSDQVLPEYFRAGCALTVRRAPFEKDGPDALSMTFALAYSNVLNNTPDVTGGRASWGAGLEFLLGGIVALRGGITIQPVTNIYGAEGSVAFRYGTGVNLPLERLGIPIPLLLSASYSAIPLHDVGAAFFWPERHALDAFSFDVRLK